MGGGGNNGGGINDYDSGNYNTYGLSASFLEGLGIQGPLHTKVFVANVSIVFLFFLLLVGNCLRVFVDHANLCYYLRSFSHVVLRLDWISLFYLT